MKNFKLKLRRHEFETLHELLKGVLDRDKAEGMEEKLVHHLLHRILKRLHDKSLILQDKYVINLSVEEAMAFHIYWCYFPISNIVTSAVVCRVVGEIDQIFA